MSDAPWIEQENRDFSSFAIRHKTADTESGFRERAMIFFGEADTKDEWGVVIKPDWYLGNGLHGIRIDTFGYGRNGDKALTVHAEDDHEAVARGIGLVMRAFRAAQNARSCRPTGLRLAA